MNEWIVHGNAAGSNSSNLATVDDFFNENSLKKSFEIGSSFTKDRKTGHAIYFSRKSTSRDTNTAGFLGEKGDVTSHVSICFLTVFCIFQNIQDKITG